jgi:hypothetical protein
MTPLVKARLASIPVVQWTPADVANMAVGCGRPALAAAFRQQGDVSGAALVHGNLTDSFVSFAALLESCPESGHGDGALLLWALEKKLPVVAQHLLSLLPPHVPALPASAHGTALEVALSHNVSSAVPSLRSAASARLAALGWSDAALHSNWTAGDVANWLLLHDRRSLVPAFRADDVNGTMLVALRSAAAVTTGAPKVLRSSGIGLRMCPYRSRCCSIDHLLTAARTGGPYLCAAGSRRPGGGRERTHGGGAAGGVGRLAHAAAVDCARGRLRGLFAVRCDARIFALHGRNAGGTDAAAEPSGRSRRRHAAGVDPHRYARHGQERVDGPPVPAPARVSRRTARGGVDRPAGMLEGRGEENGGQSVVRHTSKRNCSHSSWALPSPRVTSRNDCIPSATGARVVDGGRRHALHPIVQSVCRGRFHARGAAGTPWPHTGTKPLALKALALLGLALPFAVSAGFRFTSPGQGLSDALLLWDATVVSNACVVS